MGGLPDRWERVRKGKRFTNMLTKYLNSNVAMVSAAFGRTAERGFNIGEHAWMYHASMAVEMNALAVDMTPLRALLSVSIT
jgi:hypothetical protein